MNFEQLDILAQKYMMHRKSHKEREMGAAYFHCKRVSQSVTILREKLFPENRDWDDVLRCAGLFHDIGKGIEPHNHSGAVLVRDLLKHEMSAAELDKVCVLIEAHTDRQPGTDIHTDCEKLLQDADLLDHYGSQGIWMSCIYYAYMGQKEMAQVPAFYFSEWQEQVKKHRQALNYEISKAIFDEKIQFEQMVARRMESEGKGNYIGKEFADESAIYNMV